MRLLALHNHAAKILWADSDAPEIDAHKLVGQRLSDWADGENHREEIKTKISRCIVHHEPADFTAHLLIQGQRVILKITTSCLSLQEVAAITTAKVIPLSISELSDREKECLTLLARGRTTKQIGRQLRIASSTVETHMARAKVKLGLKTHDALLAFALDYLRE